MGVSEKSFPWGKHVYFWKYALYSYHKKEFICNYQVQQFSGYSGEVGIIFFILKEIF